MATLPVVTERGVQSSGQTPGYQQVDYNPDAFGAGVGRALTDSAQQLRRAAEIETQIRDTRSTQDVLKSVVAGKDEARQWLYDPNDGVLSKTGGNAQGTGEQMDSVLADIKTRQLDGLTDPKAKATFERMWAAEEDQVKNQVASHELNQLGAYKVETTKGVLLSSMQDAYNSYNDQAAIDKAIGLTRTAIAANTMGMPAESTKAAEAEAVSGIHLAVINRWAQEDPETALKYYEANKDAISGKDHVTATAFVDTMRKERKADEFVAYTTQVPKAVEDLWPALEYAETGTTSSRVSSEGALGVGQLLIGTAREQAQIMGMSELVKLSDEELTAKLLSDDTLNRKLGKGYLARQLKAFNGDVEAALVAYNAGPEGAKDFLKHNAGVPPGSRNYEVPGRGKIKTETEGYVNKVLGRAGVGQDMSGQRMTPQNWTLKNFKPEDILAPTDGGRWVDAQAATSLDSVATRMAERFPGFKVKINEAPSKDGTTNGRRRGTSDPKDNPHVKNSQHVHGTAFDVQVQGWSDQQKAAFLVEARAAGFAGVGFYGPNGHLHIDMGSERKWGNVPEWARAALKVPVGKVPGRRASAPGTSAGAGGTGAQTPGSFFVSTDRPALESWLAQANEITDPTVRERAMSKIRVQGAIQEAAVKQAESALKQQAWETVLSQGFKALPPEVVAKLGREEATALRNAEAGIETNWERYSQLKMLSEEELLQVDPYDHRGNLADPEFKELTSLIAAARAAKSGDVKAKLMMAGLSTRNELIKSVQNQMSWDTKYPSGAANLAKFTRRLDEVQFQEQQAKGSELNAIELQDVIDKLLIEDRSKGLFGISWSQGKAMEATDPNTFTAARAWEEVQSDDQALVTTTYETFFQKPPTQEAATDIYNRAMRVYLGGKPAGPDDETTGLRAALSESLGRKLNDADFERYYGKWLLKFLGR